MSLTLFIVGSHSNRVDTEQFLHRHNHSQSTTAHIAQFPINLLLTQRRITRCLFHRLSHGHLLVVQGAVAHRRGHRGGHAGVVVTDNVVAGRHGVAAEGKG